MCSARALFEANFRSAHIVGMLPRYLCDGAPVARHTHVPLAATRHSFFVNWYNPYIMGNKHSELDRLTAGAGELVEVQTWAPAGGIAVPIPRGDWIMTQLQVAGGDDSDRVVLNIGAHEIRADRQDGAPAKKWTFGERVPLYMLPEDPVLSVGRAEPGPVQYSYRRYPAPPPLTRQRTVRGDSLIYLPAAAH